MLSGLLIRMGGAIGKCGQFIYITWPPTAQEKKGKEKKFLMGENTGNWDKTQGISCG